MSERSYRMYFQLNSRFGSCQGVPDRRSNLKSSGFLVRLKFSGDNFSWGVGGGCSKLACPLGLLFFSSVHKLPSAAEAGAQQYAQLDVLLMTLGHFLTPPALAVLVAFKELAPPPLCTAKLAFCYTAVLLAW